MYTHSVAMFISVVPAPCMCFVSAPCMCFVCRCLLVLHKCCSSLDTLFGTYMLPGVREEGVSLPS
jgi:hypothetical protein